MAKTITFEFEAFKHFLSEIQESEFNWRDDLLYGHFRVTDDGAIIEDWDTIMSDEIVRTEKKELKGEVKE